MTEHEQAKAARWTRRQHGDRVRYDGHKARARRAELRQRAERKAERWSVCVR